ncbi:MAG: hypothetical protein AAFQ45_14360 [Pseudomonadota bacterium]
MNADVKQPRAEAVSAASVRDRANLSRRSAEDALELAAAKLHADEPLSMPPATLTTGLAARLSEDTEEATATPLEPAEAFAVAATAGTPGLGAGCNFDDAGVASLGGGANDRQGAGRCDCRLDQRLRLRHLSCGGHDLSKAVATDTDHCHRSRTQTQHDSLSKCLSRYLL